MTERGAGWRVNEGGWSIGTRAQTAASRALFRVDVFSFDATDDVIAMRRRVDALIRHGDMVRSALTEPAPSDANPADRSRPLRPESTT